VKKNIFPTPVYVGNVDKRHIDHELSLINLHTQVQRVGIFSNQIWACDVMTGHNTNLTKEKDAWVAAFKQAIEPCVTEYIMSIRESSKEFKYFFDIPWINIYQKHDYQEQHHHAGGEDGIGNVLSYAYMHKLPENGGRFFFVNNNSYANYVGQASCFVKTADLRYYPDVQEGSIVIFPSWLSHMVEPNRSEEERITISGNIYFLEK